MNYGCISGQDIESILPVSEIRSSYLSGAGTKVAKRRISLKPKLYGGNIRMKLKSMQESLDRDLRDPEYVALYLNDALHEGSPEEFYLALRNVIKANQGMSQIATETELGRESLYKALSESGNPQFSTVSKIVGALGLQISIEPVGLNS